MTQYRVLVQIEGTLRVAAESPEEAERMAAEAPVRMAGCKLFGQELGADAEELGWWRRQLARLLLWCGLGSPWVRSRVLGLVTRHSLAPDDVRQRQGLEEG